MAQKLTRAHVEQLIEYTRRQNRPLDLRWFDLSWLDLDGIDLSRTNLTGANLVRTNLSQANLSETNLSGADLSEANLSGADLSEADLMSSWLPPSHEAGDLLRVTAGIRRYAHRTHSHNRNTFVANSPSSSVWVTGE